MAVSTSEQRAVAMKLTKLLSSGQLGDLDGERLDLSVIIPILNEEESIPPLHEQLVRSLRVVGRSYEIIYVDDGSRDRSFDCLATIASADRCVLVIQFRRNFGQTAAIQAGIEHSHGGVLVFMDADLQNDPTDIGRLLEKLEQGYDVVSGWRANRQDALLSRKIPSRLANGLISRVTGVHLHDYGCTLKVYRREVIRDMKLYGEMHRFMPAFAALAGASVAELPVLHHARRFGRSKYGITRTFRVLLDLMTVKFLSSYSTKPSYAFGFIGIVLWLMAFVSGLTVIIQKVLPPHPWAHNNPLLLVAAFLAIVGTQFIFMGLLAELLARTYHESQNKPIYVVRRVVQAGRTSTSR